MNMQIIIRSISLALVLMGAGMLLLAWHVVSADDGGTPKPNMAAADDESEVEPVEMIPYETWTVLRTTTNVLSGVQDSEVSRFRLAGTFLLLDDSGADSNAEEQRRAILDDIETDQQFMVSEGELFEGYEIVRVLLERVILRRDGEEIELSLSFTGKASTNTTESAAEPGEDKPAAAMDEADEVALETNRFGKRIGETRWVIQKDALRDYYSELINEPERAAAIYASMKPDRDEAGAIKGYRLQTEGEGDFFKDVGLLEGDKIRKVNSMNMTSQARAEYFISEFGQDRLGAVVLDIERDGEEKKLIYFLR